jgi:hypothetical protein
VLEIWANAPFLNAEYRGERALALLAGLSGDGKSGVTRMKPKPSPTSPSDQPIVHGKCIPKICPQYVKSVLMSFL